MRFNGPAGRTETAAQRRARAWELRLRGMSVRKIAEEIGVSHTAVEKMLKRTLEDLRGSELRDAEAVRDIELERLDALTSALWPDAMAGDAQAVGRLTELMNRRAKLLGLDAPVKGALTDSKGNDLGNAIAEAAATLDGRLAEILACSETDGDAGEAVGG